MARNVEGGYAKPVNIENDILDVEIAAFPPSALGQRPIAESLSVVPASNIPAATYAGAVDIESFPAANLGQQAIANSLSIVPASNIPDTTYVGDIKFGEAVPAGEAHVGEVGGSTKIIKISGATLGVDGALYAAGQLVGAKLTLTDAARVNSGFVTLMSIVAQDLTNQKSALDFVFFDADPSGTTFTDNAALDIVDADLPKVVGRVSMAATDYTSFADNAEGTLKNLGLVMQADASGDLYMAVVCRGTPTYVANELSLVIAFYRD